MGNSNVCLPSDFYNKNVANDNTHFCPCELCKKVTLDPIDVANEVGRLLQVNVCLKNVCTGKELTVGCIIMDGNSNILAFKSQTFTAGSCSETCPNASPCTNVIRTFNFILPSISLCSELDVTAKIIANYTHPCLS